MNEPQAIHPAVPKNQRPTPTFGALAHTIRESAIDQISLRKERQALIVWQNNMQFQPATGPVTIEGELTAPTVQTRTPLPDTSNPEDEYSRRKKAIQQLEAQSGAPVAPIVPTAKNPKTGSLLDQQGSNPEDAPPTNPFEGNDHLQRLQQTNASRTMACLSSTGIALITAASVPSLAAFPLAVAGAAAVFTLLNARRMIALGPATKLDTAMRKQDAAIKHAEELNNNPPSLAEQNAEQLRADASRRMATARTEVSRAFQKASEPTPLQRALFSHLRIDKNRIHVQMSGLDNRARQAHRKISPASPL